MVRSLGEANLEQKEKYKTLDQTWKDFKKNQKVKIICICQDFHYFNGETATIIKSEDGYLKIKVKFDNPRGFQDGSGGVWYQTHFNFAPSDLIHIKRYTKDFKNEQTI